MCHEASYYLTHQIKIWHLAIQLPSECRSCMVTLATFPMLNLEIKSGNEAMVTYGWTINEPHLPKMTVKYLALQKRNVGLIKNEFDDQLFCNFMLVPDQGWNSNYIMYYWMNMHMGPVFVSLISRLSLRAKWQSWVGPGNEARCLLIFIAILYIIWYTRDVNLNHGKSLDVVWTMNLSTHW